MKKFFKIVFTCLAFGTALSSCSSYTVDFNNAKELNMAIKSHVDVKGKVAKVLCGNIEYGSRGYTFKNSTLCMIFVTSDNPNKKYDEALTLKVKDVGFDSTSYNEVFYIVYYEKFA